MKNGSKYASRLEQIHERRANDMSDHNLTGQVLKVLKSSPLPMKAKDLFDVLESQHISKQQGRRGLFALTTNHRVEISSNRTIKLLPGSHRSSSGQ